MPYTTRPYCPACITWYPTLDSLRLHQQECPAGNSSSSPSHFHCSLCPGKPEFSTLHSLQRHSLSIHGYQSKFFCAKCVLWMKNGEDFVEHKRTCGNGKENDKGKKEDNEGEADEDVLTPLEGSEDEGDDEA